MADRDPKKAQRLVSFRKLQQERASMEVHAARTAVSTAHFAVEAQEQLIEQEAAEACPENGMAVRAEDITLALACVEAARGDLKQKQTVLKNAENILGKKSGVLLAAHKKVRQMEALAEASQTLQKKVARSKENREIDDMAVGREARK